MQNDDDERKRIERMQLLFVVGTAIDGGMSAAAASVVISGQTKREREEELQRIRARARGRSL